MKQVPNRQKMFVKPNQDRRKYLVYSDRKNSALKKRVGAAGTRNSPAYRKTS